MRTHPRDGCGGAGAATSMPASKKSNSGSPLPCPFPVPDTAADPAASAPEDDPPLFLAPGVPSKGVRCGL